MLKVAGIELEVDSTGGLGTCVQVPSWKLAFDIGRAPRGAARRKRVFFSHAHIDHMGGVAHHCATRDLMGMSPPEYWMPAANVEAFHGLLDAWRSLDGSPLPCETHGVRPGDVVPLGPRRSVHVFATTHRVPSVGYALVERRRRLREDLVGLEGEAIRALKDAGEAIVREEEVVALAYTGDTSIEVVDREPLVRRARVLVMEITFLDGRVPPANAHRLGHVHLDDVLARADLFENEALVSIHLSARYGLHEARDILRRRLPGSLRDRVVLAGRDEEGGDNGLATK